MEQATFSTLTPGLKNGVHFKPDWPTRNHKLLVDLIPPWTEKLVVWELRVGEYRIFYDVSEKDETVYVRAIRKKLPGETTEEIL